MIQPTMPVHGAGGALFGVPTPNGEPCASAASIAPAASSDRGDRDGGDQKRARGALHEIPCLPPLSGIRNI